MFAHEPAGGTAEFLRVYDTAVQRYVAGVWTALTSVTMTTNKQADFAHFPLTGKTYIVNGTDNVVKYTSSTAGDQSDGDFKKGTSIVHYKNRLLVAVGNVLWYTDLGVDTFSTNNYVKCEGDITDLEVYFNKVLVFTKRKVYVIQNFSFNGVAAGPESMLPLRTDFGAIAGRTVKKVNNLIYFLGQDSENKAAVYVTDATSVVVVSDKISTDINDIATGSLTNACAGTWGEKYRLSTTPTGETTNTKEFIYDTSRKIWFPPYDNNVGGFSCYESIEVSGDRQLYAGSQTLGETYKLNTVDYDEVHESYLTGYDTDTAIDGNPAKRAAQSFKLSDYQTQEDVTVNSVLLRMKKNAGTTTELTVRIETDDNGVPSGTLADAQATGTISAFTSTSYAYKQVNYTGVTLKGNTTYWIVVKHTTEGSGNSQYYLSVDGSSPTYSNGNIATYAAATVDITDNFYPDAHPETTTVDGYVYNHLVSPYTTFDNIRNVEYITTPSPSSTSIMLYLRKAGSGDVYDSLSRGIVCFDTSSIPDDATIVSATLGLYFNYVYDGLLRSVGITTCTTDSDTTIIGDDYDITNYGADRLATDKTVSSLSTSSYTDFTLNATGLAAISLSGVTKLSVRFDSDIDNTAPTGFDSISTSTLVYFSSSEGNYKPRLTVTYSSATGVSTWASDADKDANFLVNTQGKIDSNVVTKAFYLAPQGQQAKVKDLIVNADASGNYSIKSGINTGLYDSYEEQDLTLSSGGSLYGSTFTIGTSILGSVSRISQRLRFSLRGKSFKFRFRNYAPNQPFRIFGFRTRHQIETKIR